MCMSLQTRNREGGPELRLPLRYLQDSTMKLAAAQSLRLLCCGVLNSIPNIAIVSHISNIPQDDVGNYFRSLWGVP